jgi:hypothetical protein
MVSGIGQYQQDSGEFFVITGKDIFVNWYTQEVFPI